MIISNLLVLILSIWNSLHTIQYVDSCEENIRWVEEKYGESLQTLANQHFHPDPAPFFQGKRSPSG